MANPTRAVCPSSSTSGPDDEHAEDGRRPPTRSPTEIRRSIVRRAPFADSPYVGERGQKAQLRILEAALEVFGEVGYQRCGVKRITELSGYSRASFYQYFSSKEDLFRHLAGRVAELLNESAEALEPITGDLAGWESFHRWLERYSEIYDAYEPVFVTFQTAVASDAMVASGVGGRGHPHLQGPARQDRRLAAAPERDRHGDPERCSRPSPGSTARPSCSSWWRPAAPSTASG